MSKRELKALNVELSSESTESRLRSGTLRTVERRIMNGHEGNEELEKLREELARAQTQLTEQQEELTATKTKLLDAEDKAVSAYDRAKELEVELNTARLQAEIDKLREVDAVRKEFAIERKQLRELDAARATELKAGMAAAKEGLLKRISELEKQLAEGARVSPSSGSGEPERMLERDGAHGKGGTDPAHDGPGASDDVEGPGSGGGDDHTHEGRESDGSHTHDSADDDSHEADGGGGGGDRHSTRSATGTPGSSGVAGADVMQSVARLLEEQRKMMAAQVQAMATHSVPPLRRFTGEDTHTDEGSFDRWLEQFEDRAKMAGWNDEQCLFQLKAHMEKTAEHAIRMLPSSEKSTYKAVVAALERRFHSLDIEELRGLEFHQLMQDTQSVEEVGIQLQRLARKAFPKSEAKEFDRMLKGRFYQALLPKWQRKLGAPKPAESFDDLYARARAQEHHHQQINSRQQEDKASKQDESQKKPTESGSGAKAPVARSTSRGSSRPRPRGRGCYNCGDLDHFERNCPKPKGGSEAAGRSSQVSALTAETVNASDARGPPPPGPPFAETEQSGKPNGFHIDADRNGANTVVANSSTAVGPVLHLEVAIEGFPVQAVVDCGAQSSIISGDLFDQIRNHMVASGRGHPQRGEPTVKLFGKGGRNNGELCISDLTVLELSVDGFSVKAPIFVEPASEIPCLLGTNILPKLGVKVVRASGEVLGEDYSLNVLPSMSQVCIIHSTYIPGRKATFLEAELQTSLLGGDTLVFEPNRSTLDAFGLDAPDAVLSTIADGRVLIPVVNCSTVSARLKPGTCIGSVSCMATLRSPSVPFSPAKVTEGCEDGTGHCLTVTGETVNSPERLNHLYAALKLDKGTLTDEQFRQLKELIGENSDLFALQDSELGHTSLVQHKVDTGDHPPIKQPVRRIPFVYRDKIATMVAEMEQQGVIQPSSSPWASPVVLVPKKDGSHRFCIDYRRLNSITKKDVYPLPRIDDILDTLGGTKFFSSLDLAAGYWQIGMDDESKAKSAFITHHGLYEFVRMPFGMCNAPATFQRLMEIVLNGLVWKSCFVYIDDVLVCSRTFDEHLSHLREVFVRLRRAGLKLKAKKCLFLREEVPYLGHIVTKNGIKPDPSKTEKMDNYPSPTDVGQVRQFLGLASYYRRFVPEFSKIASPLHSLLKHDATFQWTTECQAAFEELKRLLVNAPILAYPQFQSDYPFILETDASQKGLGAVLAQQQADGKVHPIAFASRSLNVHERNYGISELETLGLVWAAKIFRAYLLGHRCVVFTDHAACTSLLNSPNPSSKLARWAMAIQELDLDIRHRSGKSNVVADALSHNPVPVTNIFQLVARSLSLDLPSCEGDIGKLQREDSELSPILQYLESGILPSDNEQARKLTLQESNFDVVDGVLYFESPANPGQWRIAVPEKLKLTLLKESHGGKFAGHFSEKKLYSTLRTKYWWKRMRADIRRYRRSCLVCASRKGPGHIKRPPLQPIPVGGPFHMVGVDVLQLPMSMDGNQYAVVFMDHFTKWPEVFAVPNQTAETIARLLVEHVISRHGVPEQLLSDRGKNFLSSLVQEVCKLIGTKKINTSGYHPQCDGLVEKFNSTLISMLSKSVGKYGRDWNKHLPYLLFAYRVAVQESTKASPFYLLYGREPQVPTSDALAQPRTIYQVDFTDYLSEMVANLSDAWALAHQNIEQAQTKQKLQYDKKSSASTLRVGDRVMVFFPSQVKGKAWKLARPYFGPYKVLSLTPTNAEVQLAHDSESESIFVALDRVRRCYDEMSDEVWMGHGVKPTKSKKSSKATKSTVSVADTPAPTYQGPITRSMSRKQPQ